MILDDSLGIAQELEQEMARVVETYQCEWQTTLNDPNHLALFRTAVNGPAAEESKRWQEICGLDEIPEQAGIGARLGRKPIALFRFGKSVYALDDQEPCSDANVLSRGILAMRRVSRWSSRRSTTAYSPARRLPWITVSLRCAPGR